MHELSIAAAIVELAEEEAASRGVRILSVHLKIGPLSGIVRQALEGSFEIAAAGTPLENARLVIQETLVVAWCPQCNARRNIPSVQWMCCPSCGTPTPEVIEGAELQVTALEVDA